MQNFMPGTQPRGTHAFDPGSSLGGHLTAELLHSIDVEEDGAEDCVDPPSLASLPAASTLGTLPFVDPSSSMSVTSSVPSLVSNISSSGGTEPLPSSSLSPTAYSLPRLQSMGSAPSLTTESDAGSSQVRKHKYDVRSMGSMQPSGSKQTSKSKNWWPKPRYYI